MEDMHDTFIEELRERIPPDYVSQVESVEILGEPTPVIRGPAKELEMLVGRRNGSITYIGFLALVPERPDITPEKQS
jgi:hypothetical protein